MLATSVPRLTRRTGSQFAATAERVSVRASTPMTTPITACAADVAGLGTRAGPAPRSASTVPTMSPANSAGDGTPRAPRPSVSGTVVATSSAQRAQAIRLNRSHLPGSPRPAASAVPPSSTPETLSDASLPLPVARRRMAGCRSGTVIVPGGDGAVPAEVSTHDGG